MRNWKVYKKEDNWKNSVKYYTDQLDCKIVAEKYEMFKLMEEQLIELEFGKK